MPIMKQILDYIFSGEVSMEHSVHLSWWRLLGVTWQSESPG